MFRSRLLRLYLALVILRFLSACLLSGYIHPDEMFQSPEVMAGDVLHYDVHVPWEYSDKANPCRSILIPALISGIPFYCLKAVTSILDIEITSSMLLLAPRISSFLTSLLLDFALVRIARFAEADPLPSLLLLASSYVTLVFQVRPFSNSAESVVLSLSLMALFWFPKFSFTSSKMLLTGTALGFLFAVGFFTRITFLFFAFPVGLAFLWRAAFHLKGANTSLPSTLSTVIAAAGSVLTAAAVFCGVFAALDSLYFGSLVITANKRALSLLEVIFQVASLEGVSFEGSLAWTTINNLRYNLDPENLALHTLHPRYLHTLVNLPLMFGPLGLVGLGVALPAIFTRRTGLTKDLTRTTCFFSGLLGLLLLSTAPHQEPRFLVPMLVPLVVALTPVVSHSRLFWIMWLIFNVITTFVFGQIHQGGTFQAIGTLKSQLSHISSCSSTNSNLLICSRTGPEPVVSPSSADLELNTKIYFLHTYMPPLHLFGVDSGTHQFASRHLQRHSNKIEVIDLFGASLEKLEQEMGRTAVPLGNEHAYADQAFSRQADGSHVQVLLIAPTVLRLDSHLFKFVPLSSAPWHLTTEHLAEYRTLSDFSLTTYRVVKML